MSSMKVDSSERERFDQQKPNDPNHQSLNIDLCLELIFPYLDVEDLVRAADSNKQMKDAAELTFSRKFGKNSFVFHSKTQDVLKSTGRTIYLDVSSIFGVLRCFGHLISKLMLDYYFSSPLVCSRLDLYVIKYSMNYVKELEIHGYENALKNIQQPFPNVENIRFISCDLDESSTRLNEWFPKLRSLEFVRDFQVCTKIDDQYCIAAHFPHLEHLSVHISNDLEVPGFREETVLAALKINPKIRSLCLNSFDYNLPLNFFQNISETCAFLETLEINGNLSEFNDMVRFKTVKTFSIYPMGCHIKSIPFVFDALETFNWKVPSSIEEFIFDFIQNNPSIKKFSFCNSFNSPVNIENINSIHSDEIN